MIFVSLAKGKVTLKPEGESSRAFDPKNIKGIGAFLAKRPGWSFLTSSSLNHPGEYGFKSSFSASQVMAKAVEHAFRKLAIVIKPGPLTEAVKTIETAAKAYPHSGPVPFLFVRSNKERKDALLVFQRDELELFLSGIQYSTNLVALAKKA